MKETKSLPLRLNLELHKFLKVYAAQNNTDMNTILVDHIIKLKKKQEKELTRKDVNV